MHLKPKLMNLNLSLRAAWPYSALPVSATLKAHQLRQTTSSFKLSAKCSKLFWALRGFVTIAMLIISCSAFAQTAEKNTATTSPGSSTTFSDNKTQVNILSKEATAAIHNFENQRKNKTEAQVKAEQAELMKMFCSHNPAYQSSHSPGASIASAEAEETWKKKYPGEYATYLQIFHFKQ